MWKYCLAILLTSGVYCAEDEPVDWKCLACICEASTQCDTKKRVCEDDECGPFSITWQYWDDSDKPTLNGMAPDHNDAFQTCALDFDCSIATLQRHMHKYKRDCNGDGKIDCDDFAAIHKFGPRGCSAKLTSFYGRVYRACKDLIDAKYKDIP